MWERHRDQVDFVVVYIREAHPEDGWVVTMNREQGIAFDDPTTDAERGEAAATCAIQLKIRMPVVVDAVEAEQAPRDEIERVVDPPDHEAVGGDAVDEGLGVEERRAELARDGADRGVVFTDPGSGAQLALATVVNPVAIPYVNTIPPILLDPETNDPIFVNGAPVPLIGPDGPLTLGQDFLLLPATAELAFGRG